MNPFLFRRIRGPVFLLTFALTAILAQWHILSFGRSWPLYLLAAGLLRLLEAALSFSPGWYSGYNAQLVPGGFPVRRRSITGGLVLLLAGVFALLLTTDVLSSGLFWRVYALWWPLLLVLLGLLLLVERLFDRGFSRRYAAYGNAGPYVSRRRRGSGLVGLIVLLVLLGLVSRGMEFHGMDDWHNWHVGPDTDWSFLSGGEEHDNDVSFAQPLAADAALTVENAHGDLQIAPSADGMIHVDAHQVAHVADRNKESAFAATRPALSIHGGSATVTVPGRNGVNVRLVLAVPEGVLCTVHNHHGDIAISGLRRALDLSQDHGDVALDSLGGSVHLVMDHGDVHARALAGDFSIEGRADDITASDVKGRTLLHGEFFGDTELDQLGGPVEFHSNRTDFQAQHMTGQLSLDSEDLRASGVAGGLKIKTRSKEVEVTGLSGDAQIMDSNSDITVSASQPLGALTLENSTGNITLSLPSGAGFSVSGQTGKDDEIDSEFALAQTTDGDLKMLSGQVGQGGPHMTVNTRHGDLTLRRTTADTEAPEKPEKPKKPEKPGHLRHLQSPGEPSAPAVQ